jgi:membrane-bound ClpP family serine protease
MSLLDIGLLVGIMLAISGALYLVQRFIPHPVREAHNDVAGFIFAAVGVLYAVLLAFVVIAVWDNNDAARKTTFKEADSLAGIYWISRQLPAPLGPQLERHTLDYARMVKDTEWPLMSHHESSPAATDLVYQMRSDVFAIQASNDQQRVLYDHAVSHLENLASERRSRLSQVDEDVPPLLWAALIIGGVLTVGFTFLFGLSNSFSHGLMVLALSGLVVISLIVIKEMDFPFAGVTAVKPTAFDVFLNRLPTPR